MICLVSDPDPTSYTTVEAPVDLEVENDFLGPEIDYYKWLVNLQEGVRMDEVSQRLTHNMTDMLLRLLATYYLYYMVQGSFTVNSLLFIINSCKWNSFTAQCNEFKEESTDVGVCYTLNGDEAKMLKARKTGLVFSFLLCECIV